MLLIALALATADQPERWVNVGGSASQYEEYLDRESLKRSGDKINLWTRRDFAGARATAWHEIEMDCAARTDTIIAWIRIDGGTVSHNSIRPHRQAAPIPKGSVQEKIFNLACR